MTRCSAGKHCLWVQEPDPLAFCLDAGLPALKKRAFQKAEVSVGCQTNPVCLCCSLESQRLALGEGKLVASRQLFVKRRSVSMTSLKPLSQVTCWAVFSDHLFPSTTPAYPEPPPPLLRSHLLTLLPASQPPFCIQRHLSKATV